MNTVKEAMDSMLSKGDITKEQYDSIEKTGAFEITKEAASANPGLFKKVMRSLFGAGEDVAGQANLFGQAKTPFQRSMEADGALGAIAKKIWPVAATGAALGAGKELLYDPAMESIKIKKSFNQMKTKIPQLADADEKELKDYFNVVKTFSPKSASNPLVAGALVNKMREFGGVDHKLVQDISAIQTGLARPSIVETATQAAAKAVSSIPGA